METFGERLRRLRRARGLSVRELARLSGKSGGYISRIETGQRLVGRLPHYDDLRAMARALDLPPDDLAGPADATGGRADPPAWGDGSAGG